MKHSIFKPSGWLVMLVMCLAMLCPPAARAQFSGSGSGTEQDPYLIYNCSQLSQMRNFLGQTVYFKLCKDLDLGPWLATSSPTNGWQPVGAKGSPFQGTLDGDGHTISGLWINRPTADFIGLFGVASDIRISNLTLKANAINGNNYVGVLVGEDNNGNFKNCQIETETIEGYGHMGGLLGSGTNSDISNCSTMVDQLQGTRYVGGLAGETKDYQISRQINKCEAKIGILSGSETLGLLIGENSANILESKTEGSITGNTDIGGLVGVLEGGNLTKCYSDCKITTSDQAAGIGGLIGTIFIGDQYAYDYYDKDDYYLDKSAKWAVYLSELKDYYPVYDPNIGMNYIKIRDVVSKNLTVNACKSHVTINSKLGEQVGGLVGRSYDRGVLGRPKECQTEVGEVSSRNNEGVWGYFASRCYYRTYYVRTFSSYTIRDCVCLGEVSGSGCTGGLAGELSLMDVSDTYFNGHINGTLRVGALAGKAESCNFAKCYVSGSIEGTNKVGGLVGTNGEGSSIKSCVAALDKIEARSSAVGRIYSQGSGEAGGLGTAETNRALASTIVILDGQKLNPEDNKMNGESISLSDLHLKATYQGLGWSFGSNESSWTILETESFPYKISQCAPPTFQSEPKAGMTVLIGRSINGGIVTMTAGEERYVADATGSNTWTAHTTPLQAGDVLHISAETPDMFPSYSNSVTVGYKGEGTSEKPYEIYSGDDLANISEPGYYRLMKDLDLAEYGSWTPLEASNIHFDGNNRTIANMTVTSPARNGAGLFARINGGSVRNLNLTNAKVSASDIPGGILAGQVNNSEITGCNVDGTVKISAGNGGLLAGSAQGSNISQCNIDGILDVEDDLAGALAGSLSDCSVASCHAKGTISGESSLGGIAGEASGALSSCTSECSLSGTGTYTGGIAGLNSATITDCNSVGTITVGNSDGYAAGISGLNRGKIEKCYASGDIVGETHWGAGIAGYNDGANASVSKCVAVMEQISLTGDNAVAMRIYGGCRNGAQQAKESDNLASSNMIVSLNGTPQLIEDSPMDGQSTAPDLLKQSKTYQDLGWAMNSTWSIDENSAFPYLTEFGATGQEINSDYGIFITDCENYSGEQTTLSVQMKNAEEVQSYQFALMLPEGFTVARDEDGELMVSNGSRTTDRKHTVSARLTGNKLTVLAYSMNNLPFVGNEGEVCVVTLASDANTPNGQYSASLSNVCLTSMDNSSIICGNSSFNITVKSDYFTAPEIKTKANAKFELPVTLINHSGIVSYQFDVVAPDGIDFAKDENGDFALTHGPRTTDTRHVFSISQRNDSTLRVLCFSDNNYEFEGNDGVLCNIGLKVQKGLPDGNYNVRLENIYLTNSDFQSIDVVPLNAMIEVETPVYTLGDVNSDNRVNISDVSGVCYLIHSPEHPKLNPLAADMDESGEINVIDVTMLTDMVHNSMGAPSRRAPGRLLGDTPSYAASTIPEFADGKFYFSPFAIKAGETKELAINFDFPEGMQFVSFQFNVNLPKGIVPVVDEDGYYDLYTTNRTNRYILQGSGPKEDGSYLVTAYNINNTPIKGTTGPVITMNVKADDNLAADITCGEIHDIIVTQQTEEDGVKNFSGLAPLANKMSVICGEPSEQISAYLYGHFDDQLVADFSTALASCDKMTWLNLYDVNSQDLTTSFTVGNPNCLQLYQEGQTFADGVNKVSGNVCPKMVLADGKPFAAPMEILAEDVTLTREAVEPQQWQGMILPFTAEASEDITVNTFDQYESASGTLVFVSGTQKANEPFTFMTQIGTDVTFHATNADISETPEQVLGNDYFAGTFSSIAQSGWTPAGQSVSTWLPFHAYVMTSEAPKFKFEGGTDTGITGINAPDDENVMIFNLQGMRIPFKVSELPTGIYIINGVKTAIK